MHFTKPKKTIMSKSFHVTAKDLKKFSKNELDEMVDDPHSLLNKWSKKISTKRKTIKNRRTPS